MSKLTAAYERSPIPRYIQVASVIRQRILSGYWVPGQKISTLEELGEEFQVARVTVRQAIEMLRAEGLVSARRGSGTFVSGAAPDREWFRVAATWPSLVESVRENVPKAVKISKRAGPPALALEDGNAAKRYVSLRSIQYRRDRPFSVVNMLLAANVYDRKPTLFTEMAALAAIDAMKVRVQSAHITFGLGNADADVADSLKVALGAPVLECHCVVVDDRSVAIYVADIVYRSDSINFRIEVPSNRAQERA
jgi:GntR family transcriptional regulator